MARFIVVEGMDGAGTTTQTKLLAAKAMRMGLKVLTSREPTNSVIGLEIRKYLAMPLEGESNLLTMLALGFAADRMHHVHHVLVPALKEHDLVIVDRYVLSSLVYQGLHLPTRFVREINQYALKPDVTLVLDIDAHQAYQRLSQRSGAKDFYETLNNLEKIRDRYRHFAHEPATILLDASGTVEQVHAHIVNVLGL